MTLAPQRFFQQSAKPEGLLSFRNRTLAPNEAKSVGRLVAPNEAKSVDGVFAPNEAKMVGEVIAPNEAKSVAPNEAKSVDGVFAPNEAKSVDRAFAPNEAKSVERMVAPNEAKSVERMVAPNEAKSVERMVAPNEAKSVERMVAPNEAKSVERMVAPNEAKSGGGVNGSFSNLTVVEPLQIVQNNGDPPPSRTASDKPPPRPRRLLTARLAPTRPDKVRPRHPLGVSPMLEPRAYLASPWRSHSEASLSPVSRSVVRHLHLPGLAVALFAVALIANVQADEPKPADVATAKKADPLPPAAPIETFKEDQKDHWAYQPIVRKTPPEVKDAAWVRNPIDRFILHDLEAADYQHAPEADAVALLRRVTFDLTGLPPTLEQVQTFLSDTRPDAYERLVDRLLDSPQYGERWAQHWLDLAHYAESNGFELDAERPDAWRYRDWVVNALNSDMSYDQFLSLQIAGDEIKPGDSAALIATGFGRAGPHEVVSGNIDPLALRQGELTEVTGTVGSVFLGMTIACARCHDHKFDAFPTTDYYRLQSFFAGTKLVELPIASKEETAAFEAAKKAIEEKVAPLKQRVAEIEAPYRTAIVAAKEARLTAAEKAVRAIPEADRTPTQKRLAEGVNNSLRILWEEVLEAVMKNQADYQERDKLRKQIYEIEYTMPRPLANAQAMADTEKDAPETFVLKRGDPRNLGVRVEPRPPGILLATIREESFKPEAIAPTETTSGRRKVLADWLTRPDNPLTARVMVNRVWQHHFGRGIVATPSDFGIRGEAPSHPELLDWLASEFINGGWKLKTLHRLMVNSATYRQASTVNATEAVKKQKEGDPDNTTLWRMNRRRMEAESLRDAMLTATGELNLKAGGPGVLVPIEREVEDLIFTEQEVVDIWPETRDLSEHNRRSLYLFRKRNVRYPMFDAFDAPDTQTACPERSVSTHALQALVMLNSDFATTRAKAFAGRLLREAGPSFDERLKLAYLLALARQPRASEVDQASRFFETQLPLLRERAKIGEELALPTNPPESVETAESAAWVDFALAMLNRNEFIYVP